MSTRFPTHSAKHSPNQHQNTLKRPGRNLVSPCGGTRKRRSVEPHKTRKWLRGTKIKQTENERGREEVLGRRDEGTWKGGKRWNPLAGL